MIFSSNWGNFNSDQRLDYLVPGVSNLICVYQGIQPTIEEYVANYNTSYNFESENILQIIVKFSKTGNSLIYTDPDSPYYTQALKSFRSGTATWAATFRSNFGTGNERIPDYHPDGYYFLTDQIVNAIGNQIRTPAISISKVWPYTTLNDGAVDGFISIVPVSDMNDNGVIKFRSTEFTHPPITDENRAIDMSVSTTIFNGE